MKPTVADRCACPADSLMLRTPLGWEILQTSPEEDSHQAMWTPFVPDKEPHYSSIPR